MIIIDFETYSPTPISAGSYKYMHDPEADMVCMAYKIDDEPTKLWTPALPFPAAEFSMSGNIYGHNILFDYLAWNVLGRNYGFPELELNQLVDTQALANRYTLPGGLAKAGEVLSLPIQKQKTGAALIKKICCPTRAGARPRHGIDYSHNDLMLFYEYCRDDVNTTYELIRALPSSKLSDSEQEYWELTQRMNLAGLPVDELAVEKILDYITSFSEEMTRRVPELSLGQVQKVTQVAKLKSWMASKGVHVDNLTAPTVEALLKQDLPDAVREMLVLRQTIGRSSTAKYQKIKDMVYERRVFNNLQYYGTSTGRWAGRGFQLQNLPRASVNDPESYISRFVDFKPVDDPVNIAKALIRPMIKAPDGRKLIVSDYSSIENRLLAWVARDEGALELFRTGGDQYIDMAAFLYKKAPADVTKGERQIGKIIILGCGYGMGAKRFVETAKTWNVHMELREAQHAVDAFRDRYSSVKNLWYKLKDACVSAIQVPGSYHTYHNCTFRVVKCRAGNKWLLLTLPSGRNLFYKDPYLESDTYGVAPGHYGTNPYTKKWSRLKLIPGRIVENVIQALARDIMAYGLVQISRKMPYIDLLGTVHDEAIGEGPDSIGPETLKLFNKSLCTLPPWAAGLPLAAEGYIGTRYKK